jgi:hypothetical protein
MSAGIDRFLGLTGRDDDEVAVRKLRAMRRLVLMTLAFEGWVALRYVPYSESPGFHAAIASALGVFALLGWHDRFALVSVGGALALELLTVVSVFPHNANHQYLAIVLLVLIALAFSGSGAGASGGVPAGAGSGADTARGPRVDPADARAAVAAMRWVVLAGLAWSGVMKLRYGYWLGGEFLSYQIATDPGFARVFAPIVPDAEWTRLVALENRIGAGPFRAQAPLLVAVSNLTWLAEIALPIGLLGLFGSRTRTFAMVASIALMIAIQAGAREIFFGGIMVGGLLLFARRDRVSPLLPVAGLCYVLWLAWPALARQLSAGGAS